jgi:starch synthase (maltosyl-transferring)
MAASAWAPNRIVIDHVSPAVASGAYPVKRVVGEPVDVAATVFADGHDVLHVVAEWQAPGGRAWTAVPMQATEPGLDRWGGRWTPAVAGPHRFRVVAWVDHFASLRHAVERKLAAGVDVGPDLLAAAALLDTAAGTRRDADALRDAAEELRAGDPVPLTDLGGHDRPSVGDRYRARLARRAAAVSRAVTVDVERERALFSTWYELFPRSWSTDPLRRPHGTLRDVADQIDYVADLGFDVLYLPPIHPIGRSFRKGPNNTEGSGPGDPGSPWAIGAAEGGHTAVHPELGTVDDLRHLVAVAADHDVEVALDLAFQCSPDHPWVTEHPEWFRHRPDGSIQYAENPPKRYQDIYPLDFEGEAWRSLWEALLEVTRFWVDQGIRVFRVDNPHTKPFAFWQWLIAELRRDHPDLILLSEAFTRPEVMHQLARVGFTQSYTYFAWRSSKEELTAYFTELSTPPSVDEFRPNAWPNTPDILAWDLHDAPREANAVRVFLAATLCPSYGIYGPAFELADNRPAGNGKEEYLHSEKYEIRRWDRNDPRSISGLIADLNRARDDQVALHTLRTLHFHAVDGDRLLCFAKTAHEGPDPDPDRPHRNPVLAVANLDPVSPQAGMVHLDLSALGLDPERPFTVHDLLGGRSFTWAGADNYVELHPDRQPGHLFRVSQSTVGEAGPLAEAGPVGEVAG